jgi:hypothetical protein
VPALCMMGNNNIIRAEGKAKFKDGCHDYSAFCKHCLDIVFKIDDLGMFMPFCYIHFLFYVLPFVFGFYV